MLQELHKKIGRSFRANECIYRIRDAGETMFLITEGKVAIKGFQNGKEILLAELSAGEIFGEMAIIENRTRCADAICISDTKVLEISSYLFEKYIQENPAIVKKLLYKMSERLRNADRQLLGTTETLALPYKAMNCGKSDKAAGDLQGVSFTE